MTPLLSRAFQRAACLPEDLQDQIAKELIEEIEGEQRWDETLLNTQEQLDRLAEKALSEYREGKTKEMGFDQL